MSCHNVRGEDGPCDCSGCRNVDQLLEALEELLAEMDNGHLGRLTKIEGVPGWQETAGTIMAREALKRGGK